MAMVVDVWGGSRVVVTEVLWALGSLMELDVADMVGLCINMHEVIFVLYYSNKQLNSGTNQLSR